MVNEYYYVNDNEAKTLCDVAKHLPAGMSIVIKIVGGWLAFADLHTMRLYFNERNFDSEHYTWQDIADDQICFF